MLTYIQQSLDYKDMEALKVNFYTDRTRNNAEKLEAVKHNIRAELKLQYGEKEQLVKDIVFLTSQRGYKLLHNSPRFHMIQNEKQLLEISLSQEEALRNLIRNETAAAYQRAARTQPTDTRVLLNMKKKSKVTDQEFNDKKNSPNFKQYCGGKSLAQTDRGAGLECPHCKEHDVRIKTRECDQQKTYHCAACQKSVSKYDIENTNLLYQILDKIKESSELE